MSRDRGPGFAVPALRLGVVPYLNVQPLVHGLAEEFPSLQLVPAPPSDLDRMLAGRSIDLGIASTFCAFTEDDRGILRAPVIASDGPVHSVLIVSREPIESLGRIYRDPHSVTSNALAAILAECRWNGAIELVDAPQGLSPIDRELPPGAGRILIGDPAIRERSRYRHIVDLGQAWREWTGLPFVFAACIGRAGVRTGQLAKALEAIEEANRERLEEVAGAYAGLPEMPPAERVRYLRDNLTFRLGPREEQAIKRFHQEAVDLGLAPAGRPIRWLE